MHESPLSVTYSGLVEVSSHLIHVSTWHDSYVWFTVTQVSGNATPDACDELPEDLSCEEAAALLGIPSAALERWAQQLAFPHAVGGAAPTRFRRTEIEALHDALVSTHSV